MRRVAHHARRTVRDALAGMRHAPHLALVAVLTVAAALLLCGITAGVWWRGAKVIDKVGTEAELTVALDPAATPERIAAIEAQLRQRPEVASVHFLTAAEDRARNRALLDPSLLEGLTTEEIPGNPCFDVRLRGDRRTEAELASLRAWAHELEGVEGVYAVYFSAERYRLLLTAVRTVRTIGVVLGSIVVLAALFFVLATTELVFLTRREEIEIMRLVGATDAFVRAPFLVEGALVGLAGGIVAVVLASIVDASIERHVALAHGWATAWGIFPPGTPTAFLGGGLALGVVGSAIVVGRRLRHAP